MADNNLHKLIKTRKSDGSHSPATEDTRDIFEKALDYAPGAGAAIGTIAGIKLMGRRAKRAGKDYEDSFNDKLTGGVVGSTVGFGAGSIPRYLDGSKKSKARK